MSVFDDTEISLRSECTEDNCVCGNYDEDENALPEIILKWKCPDLHKLLTDYVDFMLTRTMHSNAYSLPEEVTRAVLTFHNDVNEICNRAIYCFAIPQHIAIAMRKRSQRVETFLGVKSGTVCELAECAAEARYHIKLTGITYDKVTLEEYADDNDFEELRVCKRHARFIDRIYFLLHMKRNIALNLEYRISNGNLARTDFDALKNSIGEQTLSNLSNTYLYYLNDLNRPYSKDDVAPFSDWRKYVQSVNEIPKAGSLSPNIGSPMK